MTGMIQPPLSKRCDGITDLEFPDKTPLFIAIFSLGRTCITPEIQTAMISESEYKRLFLRRFQSIPYRHALHQFWDNRETDAAAAPFPVPGFIRTVKWTGESSPRGELLFPGRKPNKHYDTLMGLLERRAFRSSCKNPSCVSNKLRYRLK
jgi:hypothetical protein